MRAIQADGRPMEVLLIEDSAGDVRGTHVHAPRPDIILLDLNLTKMDGCEVLAHIKSNDNLKTIPTMILTTSEAEADVVRSYRLQANCYLNKPAQWDAFESLVKSINDFWLTKVKLPQPSHVE